MPFLIALGALAVLVLWERRGHAGRHHPHPPGMTPGPGTFGPPAPACAADQWQLPAQRDIPQEVTDRSVQILHSPAPLGTQLVERVAGRVWRFQVEIHGANELNPNPHRGVGVRFCP